MKRTTWMAIAAIASASTAIEALPLPAPRWFQLKDLDFAEKAAKAQEEIVDRPLAFLSRQFAETSQLLENFMEKLVKKPSWPPLSRSAVQPESVHIVVVDEKPLLAVHSTKTKEVPHMGKQNGPSCVVCKRFVQMVKRAIQDDLDKVQEVRDIIGDICDAMEPDSMCHTFLKRYDDIVDWLRHDTDADVICKEINMCDLKQLVQDKPCFYCDTVTTLLDMALKENPEQISEIRQYADMLCGLLGPDSKCHEFVDKFDLVVDDLKSGKRPHEICHDLKYCAKASDTTAKNSLRTFSSATDRHYDQEATALDQVDSDDDHACFYCTHITDAIRYVAENSPNQLETLRTVLKYGCKVTPKGCHCEIMVQNFDKVVEYLKKGQESSKICQELNICHNQHQVANQDNLFAHLHQYDPTTKKCFYCETFTTLLEISVKEDAQDVDMIRMYADMICGMLGDDNECRRYVKNLDTILDDLKDGQHARQICRELDYCPKGLAKWTDLVESKTSTKMSKMQKVALQKALKQVFDPKKNDLTPCFLCEQATTIVKEIVKDHLEDLQEVRDVLDSTCDGFAASNPCHAYVARFDSIVDDLVSDKSPKAICVDLELCAAAEVPVAPVGNATCAFCDTVVTILDMALQQRPDQVGELRELAGIICELLPQEDLCHDQLKTFDQVVKLLKQHRQKPHEICQTIHYCDASAAAPLLKVKQLTDWDPKLRTSKCGVCQQNVLLLTAVAATPNPQDRVDRFVQSLRAVCRLIPKSQECDVLIQHQQAVIHALEQGLDVHGICDHIHQCDGKPQEATMAFDVGCLLCEYTGQVVEHAQGNQEELRLMKSALESICVVLPPAAKCDTLTSQFDALVTQIVDGQAVHKACQHIQMCPAGRQFQRDEQQIVEQMRHAVTKSPSLKDLLAYE